MAILKKILSISLLFLYLVSSIGVTISAHYCGGDLAALSLFDDPSCCCDSSGEGTKDDCCKNENKSFRITADQNKVELSEKKFQPLLVCLPTPFAERNELSYLCLQGVFVASALPRPPEGVAMPSYKRNHAFLFYC